MGIKESIENFNEELDLIKLSDLKEPDVIIALEKLRTKLVDYLSMINTRKRPLILRFKELKINENKWKQNIKKQ